MPANSRVLLLESDRQIIDQLRDAFEERGMETEVALSGEVALGIMAERMMQIILVSWAFTEEPPYDLVKNVSLANPKARIMVYGAAKTKAHQKKMLRSGARDVIQEPVEVAQILKAVEDGIESGE
ncbi:MAG TPA: response regulator [Candidatus Brocadiia bacterium]|nr:response regulator [Candidatus Brocadiia bacterium]